MAGPTSYKPLNSLENFSLTLSITEKVNEWNQGPDSVGSIVRPRVVGFVATPFTSLIDFVAHLVLAGLTAVSGLLVSPYNFIAKKLNKPQLKEQMEFSASVTHLNRALGHLADIATLPIVALLDPVRAHGLLCGHQNKKPEEKKPEDLSEQLAILKQEKEALEKALGDQKTALEQKIADLQKMIDGTNPKPSDAQQPSPLTSSVVPQSSSLTSSAQRRRTVSEPLPPIKDLLPPPPPPPPPQAPTAAAQTPPLQAFPIAPPIPFDPVQLQQAGGKLKRVGTLKKREIYQTFKVALQAKAPIGVPKSIPLADSQDWATVKEKPKAARPANPFATEEPPVDIKVLKENLKTFKEELEQGKGNTTEAVLQHLSKAKVILEADASAYLEANKKLEEQEKKSQKNEESETLRALTAPNMKKDTKKASKLEQDVFHLTMALETTRANFKALVHVLYEGLPPAKPGVPDLHRVMLTAPEDKASKDALQAQKFIKALESSIEAETVNSGEQERLTRDSTAFFLNILANIEKSAGEFVNSVRGLDKRANTEDIQNWYFNKLRQDQLTIFMCVEQYFEIISDAEDKCTPAKDLQTGLIAAVEGRRGRRSRSLSESQ